eukprot:5036019-Pleurochrysis_carterae.AAC.1
MEVHVHFPTGCLRFPNAASTMQGLLSNPQGCCFSASSSFFMLEVFYESEVKRNTPVPKRLTLKK